MIIKIFLKKLLILKNLKNKYNFKIFNEAFNDENEAIVALEEFEALFIMRERTPITKTLLDNLPKLKYIMTSGMRNNSIDLEVTKKKELWCVELKLIQILLLRLLGL